jgi:hypothetical protein
MTTPGVLPGGFGIALLPRISPGRFIGLKSCRLREIWASNRVPALLPTNARARLGTIIHETLAAAGRGEFSSETAVENYWTTAVNNTEQEMLGSWLERSLVPLRKSVRNYEVVVLRAINKAREIALSRSPRTAPAPIGPAAGFGFELWVRTPDKKVCGYIDHVFSDETAIVIRDYKSGYLFESKDEQVVKEAFVVQLRLYAALYSFTFGQWPTRLELTPMQGPGAVVPFDPEQCIGLVSEAKSLLDDANAIVLRVNEKGLSPATLASPSPETCIHCAYRPNCSAYLHVQKNADSDWPLDVWGILKNVQRLMNGQLAVILETSNGTEAIRGISSQERHPALASVATGDRLAIFNLQKSFPVGGLQEGLYTTIYRWPG